MIKKIIKVAIVASFCLLAIGVYNYMKESSVDKTLDLIISLCDGGGKLKDYQDQTGVTDVNKDIYWTLDKKNFKIGYGRLRMQWPVEKVLNNQELLDRLSRIGFKVQVESDEKVHVYYLGKELEQSVILK